MNQKCRYKKGKKIASRLDSVKMDKIMASSLHRLKLFQVKRNVTKVGNRHKKST
jgi:hypothetical protein